MPRRPAFKPIWSVTPTAGTLGKLGSALAKPPSWTAITNGRGSGWKRSNNSIRTTRSAPTPWRTSARLPWRNADTNRLKPGSVVRLTDSPKPSTKTARDMDWPARWRSWASGLKPNGCFWPWRPRPPALWPTMLSTGWVPCCTPKVGLPRRWRSWMPSRLGWPPAPADRQPVWDKAGPCSNWGVWKKPKRPSGRSLTMLVWASKPASGSVWRKRPGPTGRRQPTHCWPPPPMPPSTNCCPPSGSTPDTRCCGPAIRRGPPPSSTRCWGFPARGTPIGRMPSVASWKPPWFPGTTRPSMGWPTSSVANSPEARGWLTSSGCWPIRWCSGTNMHGLRRSSSPWPPIPERPMRKPITCWPLPIAGSGATTRPWPSCRPCWTTPNRRFMPKHSWFRPFC